MLFIDEIHDYQRFVVDNFYLLGSQYKLLQEQYHVKNAILDILGYNNSSKNLVIIELKNPEANIKAISQIIKYYSYLKNATFSNYDIENTPECFIIAPRFHSKIILPDSPDIKLLQFDNIYTEFKDVTLKYKSLSSTSVQVKQKQTLLASQSKINLVNRLIKRIQYLYNNNLLVTQYQNKVCLLDKESKRLVAKLIYSYQWILDDLELILYNKFIRTYDYYSFKYDPAVLKIKEYKTMIKLKVKDIPQFLLEERK